MLVLHDVTARGVRMSNRHLLSSALRFHRHIPCTSLDSSSLPLFVSLCLSDSVLACFHPCFSRQGSLNNRSGSLSELILTWFCRFCMRYQQRASQTTSNVSVSFNIRRQNVHSQQKSRSFFVSRDFLHLCCFRNHHMSRVVKRIFSLRLFPSVTQCLFCHTFASHNSTIGGF